MKKNRIFLSVSLVLLLMIFIVNVAGASNFKVIEDQMGRQVTIPADVKRVVTTWKPSTFMVFAVGGEEKLVGVDNSSTVNKFLTGVYPGIKNIRKVGDKRHGLNIEEI